MSAYLCNWYSADHSSTLYILYTELCLQYKLWYNTHNILLLTVQNWIKVILKINRKKGKFPQHSRVPWHVFPNQLWLYLKLWKWVIIVRCFYKPRVYEHVWRESWNDMVQSDAYLIQGIQRLRVLTVQEVVKAHPLLSWAWSSLNTVTVIIAWASSLAVFVNQSIYSINQSIFSIFNSLIESLKKLLLALSMLT